MNIKDKKVLEKIKNASSASAPPVNRKKETARKNFIENVKSRNVNGEAPELIENHTYVADGWYYVSSLESVPVREIISALKSVDINLPMKDFHSGGRYETDLKSDRAHLVYLSAAGKSTNLEEARGNVVFITRPEDAMMFENMDNFFTVRADLRSPSKMN